MPPALFSVGTQDAVLDDSLFMAARWQAAGNGAELAIYPNAPHLFLTEATAVAATAQQRIIDFLRCYSR
jgi:acetyl esterase/lipase